MSGAATSKAEIVVATRTAVYQTLYAFARSQGASETQALVYAARWNGEVHLS